MTEIKFNAWFRVGGAYAMREEDDILVTVVGKRHGTDEDYCRALNGSNWVKPGEEFELVNAAATEMNVMFLRRRELTFMLFKKKAAAA